MGQPRHAPSWYAATANDATGHPPLAGETAADVCILGGGYSGLSAGLELAQRGFRVVLLEAARIGWGASGRNGGQICSGFAPSMARIAGWVGPEDAHRLWLCAEEAKAIIRERVERHAIACDLAWGYLHAALKPRQVAELAEELELWQGQHGYGQARLVDRAGMQAMVETEAYAGGLLDEGGGHLHPLNYALGLARAAREAGVALHEGSRVLGFEGRGPVTVRTAAGAVKARFLVLCGNAYLGGLVPALRRRIMPVGTYIAATQPLGRERAERLIRGNLAVADANFVINYFRRSSDHRLLFGGRVSYTTVMPPNLPGAMRRSMVRVFPQLAGIGFDYVWGGNVAITVERTPHLGRLDGDVYFAHGFSGLGVALTGIAGRVLAEAIAGTAGRLDLFARLPHTSFPGGPLFRTPALAAAMLWYRLKDLL
ncbi:MAG: FAD-binding oxidoreductase [Dongiaceae bacterium]